MAISHLLEDFGAEVAAKPATTDVSEEMLEETRSVSYENGYTAGWDDAVSVKTKEAVHISANLASSLEDLSFTYHEAQTQLIESLDPMFKVLTSAVLPDAMAASFGHHIVDQLTDMAKGQSDHGMQIVVSPGEGSQVRALLTKSFAVPVKVHEDASLEEGQAFLRIGESERELNSASLIESFRDSIDAFTYHFKEDSQYG